MLSKFRHDNQETHIQGLIIIDSPGDPIILEKKEY